MATKKKKTKSKPKIKRQRITEHVDVPEIFTLDDTETLEDDKEIQRLLEGKRLRGRLL